MSKAKAYQNMLQAMSFGIYRGGDKQNLKEIKEIFIANGGDGKIFDKVVDLNQSNFKMVNYMENIKKEYQDLTAAGYNNLAKDKMNVAMQNVAKMGNENLDKFEQYKTDLAVSEAGSPIQIKDVMQPAKDVKQAAFDLFEKEQIKNYPTTSEQVNTESGPIAEKIYNSILTKDSYKKLLPQNWLSTFNQMIPFMPFTPVTEKEKQAALIKNMEPRERYLYNLARGEDPDNPMTRSETAKFMDKNKMNFAMKNVATMGNENLEKFEKYKTNLDQLQIKDVMQPAKDAQKAGIELLEEEQIKNFPTTSSQVHTEKGPVANELFNAYWTKDAWKKFLPQNIFLGNFAGPVTDNEKLDAWLKDFQKRDPEGFAKWNLENRGQDVNNPITLDETAKFMDANKKILGYSVPKAEGGITELRSKYEYKK